MYILQVILENILKLPKCKTWLYYLLTASTIQNLKMFIYQISTIQYQGCEHQHHMEIENILIS